MRVVLDASVLVRALVAEDERAAAWVALIDEADTTASAPELVFAEVAQALAGYVRSGVLGRKAAHTRLEFVTELPLTVYGVGELVGAAIGVALERDLSVYDACYAVLAEADEAILVTADRLLAAAVQGSELVA